MFEPVNALERLLIAAATDPDARDAFIQAFLTSEVFLSPAGDPPADGSLGDIIVSHQPNGTPAAALFTARERLVEVVGPQGRVWGWNGRKAFEALRGKTVHLNPNLTPQVVWGPEDIAAILGESVQVQASGQIMLTHPLVRPDALIAALKAELGKVDAVKGAWMLQADQGVQRTWLLGVKHDGPWAAVDRAIAAAVKAAGPSDRPLQAMPIDNNTLSRELRRGMIIIEPNKLLGIF